MVLKNNLATQVGPVEIEYQESNSDHCNTDYSTQQFPIGLKNMELAPHTPQYVSRCGQGSFLQCWTRDIKHTWCMKIKLLLLHRWLFHMVLMTGSSWKQKFLCSQDADTGKKESVKMLEAEQLVRDQKSFQDNESNSLQKMCHMMIMAKLLKAFSKIACVYHQ